MNFWSRQRRRQAGSQRINQIFEEYLRWQEENNVRFTKGTFKDENGIDRDYNVWYDSIAKRPKQLRVKKEGTPLYKLNEVCFLVETRSSRAAWPKTASEDDILVISAGEETLYEAPAAETLNRIFPLGIPSGGMENICQVIYDRLLKKGEIIYPAEALN